MASGPVKWFNAQKGSWLHRAERWVKGRFVHISAVERAGLSTLNEGQKITYELERVSRARPLRPTFRPADNSGRRLASPRL